MHEQFRRHGSTGQAKKILGIRVVRLPDESPDVSYLEDSGRWKGEDGILHEPYRAADLERLDAFHRGEWGMIGIQAVADILVGGVQQEIASGGLWGIEDDSDSKYLIEVGEEELSALSSLLEDLGFKPVAIKDAVKQARWEL